MGLTVPDPTAGQVLPCMFNWFCLSRVDPCGSFWDSEASQNQSNPCWFSPALFYIAALGKMINLAPQSKKSHGSLHIWHGIVSIISLGENWGYLISFFCFPSIKCSTNGNLSTDLHKLSPQEAANETGNYWCARQGGTFCKLIKGQGVKKPHKRRQRRNLKCCLNINNNMNPIAMVVTATQVLIKRILMLRATSWFVKFLSQGSGFVLKHAWMRCWYPSTGRLYWFLK